MRAQLRILPTMVAVLLVAALMPMSSADALQPGAEREWIVVLRPHVDDVRSVARGLSGEVDRVHGRTFEHAFKGFTVSLTNAEAAALAASPSVAFVEPDVVVSGSSQTVPAGIERVGGLNNDDVAIGRVGGGTGIDVDVAVLDTGIDLDHPDLNVVGGVDCTNRSIGGNCMIGGDDDHFHGTHVAGTIGALDNDVGVVGVAPGARLWAVKVLGADNKGFMSDLLAGIDWVAENSDVIDVANMSLGAPGYSQAQYNAIDQAVSAGVAFAVSAGNNSAPAADYSPAMFDNVLTVSAMADYDGLPGGLANPTCSADADDSSASFSNYGSAVDVTAPGVCVLSTVPTEFGTGYGRLNGTSMATPHVAGALALLAAHNRPADATAVEALYDAVRSAGNDQWTDLANDGATEPLLDVSRFSPVAGVLPEEAPPSPIKIGDVNCDSSTSILDALRVAQFVTGGTASAATCEIAAGGSAVFVDAADVNGDATISILDALVIAQCVAGLESCPF